MSTIETTMPVNGIDIDAIRGARQALTDSPEAAHFQWRARCEWVNGTHSRTTIADFFGLGENHTHRSPFVLDGDHPEVFASEDHGPTPVETVLAALAGCLTAGVASVASNRGVALRTVTAVVEGDMDLQGILGIDPETRNGYSNIRVRYDIDADASREELESIIRQSQKRSAVFDILTNPTSVSVGLA